MIDWIGGDPETCIDLALVIYMEDYEFARWGGDSWQICVNSDSGGHEWVEAQEPIEFHSRLNMPDKTK